MHAVDDANVARDVFNQVRHRPHLIEGGEGVPDQEPHSATKALPGHQPHVVVEAQLTSAVAAALDAALAAATTPQAVTAVRARFNDKVYGGHYGVLDNVPP